MKRKVRQKRRRCQTVQKTYISPLSKSRVWDRNHLARFYITSYSIVLIEVLSYYSICFFIASIMSDMVAISLSLSLWTYVIYNNTQPGGWSFVTPNIWINTTERLYTPLPCLYRVCINIISKTTVEEEKKAKRGVLFGWRHSDSDTWVNTDLHIGCRVNLLLTRQTTVKSWCHSTPSIDRSNVFELQE